MRMAGIPVVSDLLSFVGTRRVGAFAVILVLLASNVGDSAAILVASEENAKYKISWEWDPDLSRLVGLIMPQIKIIDESSHKIIGYVADEDGMRLTMYNDEQVVMTKFYLRDGLITDWQISDRTYKGYFAISIPSELVGKVESISIFINNHQYTVDDGTSTTRQSWVFANSAQATHKLGSLIYLGGFTLGFEKFFSNVARPDIIAYDENLRGNEKYDVYNFDASYSPRFLAPLDNVIIRYDTSALPRVWYDLPTALDFQDGHPFTTCDPAPGSTFELGTNIVSCHANYDSHPAIYSYYIVDVPEYPLTRISDFSREVQIDIQPFYPGPNTMKLGYSSVVPVAVLGNFNMEVKQIDETTLTFGPRGTSLANPEDTYLTDANADGFDDLVVKFDVLAGGLYEGYSNITCLRGGLLNGTIFVGCDYIQVVKK